MTLQEKSTIKTKSRLTGISTKAKVHHHNNRVPGFRAQKKIQQPCFQTQDSIRGEYQCVPPSEKILQCSDNSPHLTDVVKPLTQSHTASKEQIPNSNLGMLLFFFYLHHAACHTNIFEMRVLRVPVDSSHLSKIFLASTILTFTNLQFSWVFFLPVHKCRLHGHLLKFQFKQQLT